MVIGFSNLNFWKPAIKNIAFAEKDQFLAEKIIKEQPVLLAINEHASARKYIDLLAKEISSQYAIIQPIHWDNEIHKKSLQNLLIIKDGVKYTVREDYECCLPNRLNVVDVYLLGSEKQVVHIINIYMVQTVILQPYIRKERERLQSELWKELKAIIELFKGEPTVIIGDLQESSSGENIKHLTEELGYYELVVGYAPVATFDNKTIDHILFSQEARELLNPRNYLVDNDFLSISDHPYIAVEVA